MFVDNILRVGPPLGIRVERPKMVLLMDDRTSSYVKQGQEAIRGLPDMVVFVILNDKVEWYSTLKKLTLLQDAVPSKVFQSRTLQKNAMSVCTKIVAQMTCKMGGALLGALTTLSGTMVIGIDLYKEKGSQRMVGALVATVNDNFTTYYSDVCIQNSPEALSTGFKLSMWGAVRSYNEVNHKMPKRMVIFWSGMIEGQLEMIKNSEIGELEELLNEKMGGYGLEFAYVTVNKPVNSQFFSSERNSFKNPPPGTVIDTVVTEAGKCDFFLIPQSVHHGTVNPIYFKVLENVIQDFTATTFQAMSYKLCHMYYNWPGTVRVPCGVQYASKLARRRHTHPGVKHDGVIAIVDKEDDCRMIFTANTAPCFICMNLASKMMSSWGVFAGELQNDVDKPDPTEFVSVQALMTSNVEEMPNLTTSEEFFDMPSMNSADNNEEIEIIDLEAENDSSLMDVDIDEPFPSNEDDEEVSKDSGVQSKNGGFEMLDQSAPKKHKADSSLVGSDEAGDSGFILKCRTRIVDLSLGVQKAKRLGILSVYIIKC